MAKFKTIEDGYYKITEIEYTPSLAELHFYYSGTSGSLNPDNVYNINRPLKKVSYIKKPERGQKAKGLIFE